MSRSISLKINNTEYEIAAIDIGNSRIKILIDKNTIAIPYKGDWLSQCIEFLRGNVQNALLVGISSVNPPVHDLLQNTINSFDNMTAIVVSELLEQETEIKLKHIEGIGEDRVLGLIGGLNYYKPPFITVDCGTAITVNAVNKKCECIGGAIFAGADAQLKALSESTANLSEVKMFNEEIASGKSTAQALRSGIILSVAGGIKEIVTRICEQEFNGISVPILCTGGSSELIYKESVGWEFECKRIPSLVLEGIIRLMKSARLAL